MCNGMFYSSEMGLLGRCIMRKQTMQYTSPMDALIAVAKRLSRRGLQHTGI